MSKILRNDTQAAITIADTGVTIQPGAQNAYTIPPTDYLLWADSSDIITEVGNGNIVVNDGSSDLSISDGIDLIKGIFPNPVGVDITKVNGVAVDSVNGKLKVATDASGDFTLSPMPSKKVIYKIVNLLNGSSKNMTVNGSTTPIDFDFAPAANEVFYLDSIAMFLADNGVANYDRFGIISGGLSNGIDILIKNNGSEQLVANIKDNADIIKFFDTNFAPPGTGGFMDEDDLYSGRMNFEIPIKLDGANGDYVRVRIKDDLTEVDALEFAMRAWMVNE